MRLDVAIGMALSQLIMWSVITTTAGSHHTHGITDIETVAQAATALQPLVNTFPYAGFMTKTIFALGIIGTGLLAVPVMAGASGYAFVRCTWLEARPEQKSYTGKKILRSNSHIYDYRIMDKFYKYRPA